MVHQCYWRPDIFFEEISHFITNEIAYPCPNRGGHWYSECWQFSGLWRISHSSQMFRARFLDFCWFICQISSTQNSKFWGLRCFGVPQGEMKSKFRRCLGHAPSISKPKIRQTTCLKSNQEVFQVPAVLTTKKYKYLSKVRNTSFSRVLSSLVFQHWCFSFLKSIVTRTRWPLTVLWPSRWSLHRWIQMPWMDCIKWSAQTTEGGTTEGKQPGVVDLWIFGLWIYQEITVWQMKI